VIAAVLLVLASAAAVGGSFLAFWTYTSTYTPTSGGDDEVTTTSATGWWYTTSDDSTEPLSFTPLDGAVLAIGALLAVVAAVMLLLSARRADDPPASRLVGVAGAAFLIGAVSDLFANLVSLVMSSQDEGDSGFAYSYRIGAGGWVVLGAALVALVAVGLLLAPRRGAPAGVPGYAAGGGAPYGSGYWPQATEPYGPAGQPGWPVPGRPQAPPAGPGWPAPGGPVH
jgi:hypothetical protein